MKLPLAFCRIALSIGICAAILVAQPLLLPTNWAATLPPPVSEPAAPDLEPVRAVGSFGMTVSDMDAAIAFYRDVLTFAPVSDIEVAGRPYELLQGLFGLRMRVVTMELGTESIVLTQYLAPWGRPIPIDSNSNDLWFQHVAIVVSDMEAAYARLREFDVTHASSGPQTLPATIPAAAGISAFYFQDPDGHNLEVIHFPPDKGNPRWQQPGDRLFLGIDHTAIAVADTDASRQFYQGLLGLQLAGESENFGTEQEHLNNVFGARLHISGLVASAGPGVELLEYLAPSTARPYPTDSRASDLWHWETTVVVEDAAAAAENLQAAAVDFVSPGVVTLPDDRFGFRQGFLARDPDGHVVRVVAASP